MTFHPVQVDTLLLGAEPEHRCRKQSLVQQDIANTEKVSFVAALLATDRRMTGQAGVCILHSTVFMFSLCAFCARKYFLLEET